jgi:hypothetical protein
LLTIHGRLDWRFEPVEIIREIRTGVAVFPIDWVIEKEATLWNATVSNGLRDFTGEAGVSRFGVEAGLGNGACFRASEETVKEVRDANVSTTIIGLLASSAATPVQMAKPLTTSTIKCVAP